MSQILVVINHLQYADDSVILSLSPAGLQIPPKISEDFACSNDMLFNGEKTVCMCIKYSMKPKAQLPSILLD